MVAVSDSSEVEDRGQGREDGRACFVSEDIKSIFWTLAPLGQEGRSLRCVQLYIHL